MAICVALNVVCSWIIIPYFSIPFTLQTFSIFFTLYFLGAKRGTFAILVYILLGLIGIPVFSGFKSGVKVRHAKFGEGTVIAVKGSGENLIVDVAFKGVGIKSLSAKFAPMEIVK